MLSLEENSPAVHQKRDRILYVLTFYCLAKVVLPCIEHDYGHLI